MRQKKREVKIGNVTIGGSNPIAVQTMLNVPVEDIEGNVAQAKRCEAAGCQILRVTCPSPADAKCIEAVKNAVNIPIVADIHFDYKAALACADVGVDKIRINPGNIGDDDRVKAVVDACQQKNIPIRIGVNGGSLEKHILARYGAPTPEAMVESALYHVRLLEKFDFNNIVISIKNSNVRRHRLPAPCGRHRSRHLPDGSAEKRHGHRRDAAGGHRRHHPCVAGCRAGKRGGGRL